MAVDRRGTAQPTRRIVTRWLRGPHASHGLHHGCEPTLTSYSCQIPPSLSRPIEPTMSLQAIDSAKKMRASSVH